MIDMTEDVRRALIAAGVPEDRAAFLMSREGPLLDADALRRDYEVEGFLAPYVVVKRRSDGVRGSFLFTHRPRLYFDWRPE